MKTLSAPAREAGGAPSSGAGFRAVRVPPGATLESLARQLYGSADAALIRRIQSANPQLVDPNRILAGDLLRFPDLAVEPAAGTERSTHE